MSAISFVFANLWTMVAFILPFIGVLAAIVFVHEFGHFAVGRACGAAAEVFSIGMGPEVLGFTDRAGVRWRLSAIPVGGYVRFRGDRNAASLPAGASSPVGAVEQNGTLSGRPLLARAAIVVAGPVANIVFAIAVFSGLAYDYGLTSLEPRVGGIVAASAAERAGFEKGDVVKSAGGAQVTAFSDIVNAVTGRPGEPIAFIVERSGQDVRLVATPAMMTVETPFGAQRVGRLGLTASTDPADVRTTFPSALEAMRFGFSQSLAIVSASANYIGKLALGRVSAEQLSGPVGIVQMSHHAASHGFATLIDLAAMLSLSLGVMNLLPIPMLDGGHLLFYAIEAARGGRALSIRAQEYGLRAGAVFVLALTLLATINDLWRLVGA